MFWVNSFVKSHGLVNPVPTTGVLEGATITEYAGRNLIIVVLLVVAYIWYMVRKNWFRQVNDEKRGYDDFFNKYL